MSYSTNNPPRNVVQLAFPGVVDAVARSLWLFESPDPHSVVGVPGYISNAGALGMRRGDVVMVRQIPSGEMTQHSVVALAPPLESRLPSGACSLSRIGAGWLTPPSLASGTTNNFEPRNDLGNPMSAFDHLDLDPTTGNSTLTGMTAGADVQALYVTNKNVTNSVIFAKESASSLAANRFQSAITLQPGASALLVYLAGNINRWTLPS